jgi:hypothetical protein
LTLRLAQAKMPSWPLLWALCSQSKREGTAPGARSVAGPALVHPKENQS